MQHGDRDSTQDWLVPDDPAEEISVPRPSLPPRGPSWSAGAEILAEAERSAEAAAAAADRAGIAAGQAETALQRAEGMLAADRETGAAAEQTIRSLTERVEVALEKLETRDRVAERRAEEAEREQDALRSFFSRADRIVAALAGLEQALDGARAMTGGTASPGAGPAHGSQAGSAP